MARDPVTSVAKVLYIVNESSAFLSHRALLAVGSVRAGYDVHVAANMRAGDIDQIKKLGATSHPLPIDRGSISPIQELKTFVHIFRLIRELRPDLIHNVTLKPVLYGGLCGRLLRVPVTVNALAGLGYSFNSTEFLPGVIRMVASVVLRAIARSGNSHFIVQ